MGGPVVFARNVDQDWLSKVIPFGSAVISLLNGTALSEAALGGVPIVAYDMDWQGEVMQTGIRGELVPHLDHADLVDSLERPLKDTEYARIVGAAVRNRIIVMFDPGTLKQNECNQFRAVMKRPKRQRLYDSANDVTVQ